MLQKKKLSTPTTRFATINEIFDFFKLRNKKYFLKKKIIKNNRKIFFSTKPLNVTETFGKNFSGVIQFVTYNKKPYQAFLVLNSIYNHTLTLPGIEYLLPGNKIFDLTTNLQIKKISYMGSQIFLEDLPYNLFVSCVANNLNNKWTYAKASGTCVTKLKAKKTVKLVLVELPSTQTYLFFKNTRCFIGKNTNFFNNKFVEGKWGFSLHKSKTLTVRGVAMNPVDHPNGGRTKAKQPEKSPWGWVAKQKK